jgi:hypothetical protein
VGIGVALSLAPDSKPGATSELSAAATSVALVPPTPVAYLPIAVFQKADDLEMVFTAAPGFAGENDVNFYLRDVNGDDRPYTAMTARFTYLDGRLSIAEQHPTQLHEGHWPIDQFDLALAGHWRIETTVSRDGFPDARFTFEMTLPHR